jgi:hypothetical protein
MCEGNVVCVNQNDISVIPKILKKKFEECGHFIGMRFVAFPATEYDEVLSDYQPGQIVER